MQVAIDESGHDELFGQVDYFGPLWPGDLRPDRGYFAVGNHDMEPGR
jgi:hypothetical protein